MEISELKAELEKLHAASFGWALSCCRRNHADAEEVLQTVYLKILQGKAIYRGESKLQTWLFAVIRKTAMSERRKQWLRTLISIPGATTEVHRELESEYERTEMQQRFQRALAQLPARQRETLHLVFYQDLSLSEAAEVMNIIREEETRPRGVGRGGPGRNDPCPCGSGKKYKKCCLARA